MTNESNIILIDFNRLINKSSIDILDALHEKDLLKNDKIDFRLKETKQTMYHFFIMNICNCLIQTDKKVVFIYHDYLLSENEMVHFEYCTEDSLKKFIKRFIKTMQTQLPVIVIEWEQFNQNYLENLLYSQDFSKFNFRKIEKLLKDFNLHYLYYQFKSNWLYKKILF